MEDHERLKEGDFLFGIGLAISEILSDYLESKQISDNDVGTITFIDKDKETNYDGQLLEIQTMCKNEGFQLVATKYFIPLNKVSDNYSIWTNNEFMIVKNIDYEHDSEEQKEDLTKSIGRFRQIHDYFELDESKDRLNYYLYFPENILIDSDGNGLCEVIVENQWEHKEKYGEHDH